MQGDFINYITTSRKPGDNARAFVKDIGPLLKAAYLTRGKSSLSEIIGSARYNGAERLYIITEYAGNPRQILEITIKPKTWEFSNTYFVTLHKLRKVVSEDRERIENVFYDVESKAVYELFKSSGVESDEDAKTRVIEKDGIVRVYSGKKEIGPTFKVFYKNQDSPEEPDETKEKE